MLQYLFSSKLFFFFDQRYSVSTNYKQTITQAKPAQRYGKISTSLILGGNYRSLCIYQKTRQTRLARQPKSFARFSWSHLTWHHFAALNLTSLLPRLCCPAFLCITASRTAWPTPKVIVALQVCHMFPQGHVPQGIKIPTFLITLVWLHISLSGTITSRGVRQHQMEEVIYFSWGSKAKGAVCHMQRVYCTTGWVGKVM